MQGLGQAAAEIMGRVGPGIQSGYDLAAKETAGLAAGFSSEAAARLKAALGASSAFIEEQAPGSAPGGGVDAAALQDVLYALGGYIPAASLEAQGAAANRWGEVLPAIQALTTQQTYGAATAQAREDDKQYEEQLLQLAAKRPELRAQVLQELRQYELEKLNARLARGEADLRERQFGVEASLEEKRLAIQRAAQSLYERQFGETVRSNQADEALEVAGLSIQSQKHAQAVKQAEAKGRQIDAAASKVRGFVVDKRGNFVLDESGKRIPVANSASAGKRQSAIQKANSTALAIVKENARRVAVDDSDLPPSQRGGQPREKFARSYYETIHQVEAAITPILAPYGFGVADTTKFAQRLVNQWYKPGEGGRPRAGKRKRSTRRSGR